SKPGGKRSASVPFEAKRTSTSRGYRSEFMRTRPRPSSPATTRLPRTGTKSHEGGSVCDGCALNAEIALQHLRACGDLAGRPFVGDMAVIDDVGALRQRQRGGEILLHQHDGLPGLG